MKAQASGSSRVFYQYGYESTSPRPAMPRNPPRREPGHGPGAGPGRGDRPNLITAVATTEATVADAAMTTPVHEQLAGRASARRAPGRFGLPVGRADHPRCPRLRDHAGQPDAAHSFAQAKAGAGYDKAAFAFDFDVRPVTCLQGSLQLLDPCRQPATRRWWCPRRRPRAHPARRASCAPAAGAARSPSPPRTARSARQRPRRADLGTVEGPLRRPRRRQGTMRQATHVTGIRRARYLGLPKTQLEHNIAAAAINMIRIDAYWTGHPLDRTRSSHLARLDFTLTA